jgi:membrane fusion protein (multidrug efflux system)
MQNYNQVMGSSFSGSLRSIGNDRVSPSFLVILTGIVVIGAWVIWLVTARVNIYEASDSARLEVSASVYPIAAEAGGRVKATYLAVGREVQAGDVLIEFEAEGETLRLDEARAQSDALAPQVGALRGEAAAEEIVRKQQLEAARIAIDQAGKELEEAEASVELSEDEAARIARLQSQGILSDVDLGRARTEVRKRRATAEALRLNIDRLQVDLRNRDSDSRVRIERLNRQIASLEGQIATAKATSRRLAHDVGKRVLKAPASGRIGEAVDLPPGAVINTGDKLGVIIPPGGLKAIAYFHHSALGRIHTGQPALLRLEGFPWTQYGTISAKVATVASESREGRFRVDLELEFKSGSPVPFQHGLPGRVEIEVDRLSPATLLLRAIGKRAETIKAADSIP